MYIYVRIMHDWYNTAGLSVVICMYIYIYIYTYIYVYICFHIYMCIYT